jgi:hypothetical protein
MGKQGGQRLHFIPNNHLIDFTRQLSQGLNASNSSRMFTHQLFLTENKSRSQHPEPDPLKALRLQAGYTCTAHTP